MMWGLRVGELEGGGESRWRRTPHGDDMFQFSHDTIRIRSTSTVDARRARRPSSTSGSRGCVR
eukprot:2132134-Heterocapsa_arctica.AAC.1